MTKKIRVENADASTYKVRVHIEQLRTDGTWERTGTFHDIDHPAQLIELYVHTHQRLIVEENS